ncbi:MAG: membrane protein insertion efficiency factor YidD [Treponema sp.]|jgi:putative membrane protein insertion efficiency factor|nr:membrane protein insertion efficiency factor YidD [Treponema sp.]
MAPARNLVLFLIRFYQKAISPHFPSSCRYYPTCSAYACEAVVKYGVFRGLMLAFRRILRCHPFHPGGYDPVP